MTDFKRNETIVGEWKIVAKQRVWTDGSTSVRDVEFIDPEGNTSGPLTMGELIEQIVWVLYPHGRFPYHMTKPAQEADQQ